ncbi:MAG: hypothetical protein M1331_01010 [Candidatus Marsarchaeota archaeon]|nr:hypothetical protein [Candidatus Marsarchaeota archaeon]MCL5105963.1 hypothetical protein [Candidatus Marsarchaeota archaeon]
MSNVVLNSIETYFKHIVLILFSSLSFFIALFIPFFASFVIFNDAGGIFLRMTNLSSLNAFDIFTIIVSIFFSMLFLSFAIVSINIIIKHKRTYSKIRQEVLLGLEKYTSKVFLILLIFAALIMIINIALASYAPSAAGLLSSLILLLLAPVFFYAPSSIINDDAKLLPAFKRSIAFIVKKPIYFLIWIAVAVALITFFDFIFILIGNSLAVSPFFSIYLMLIFNSIFILPFIVILQAESYMHRFALLR